MVHHHTLNKRLRLSEAETNIRALHRLRCGAFQQVILCRDDDEMIVLHGKTDITEWQAFDAFQSGHAFII